MPPGLMERNQEIAETLRIQSIPATRAASIYGGQTCSVVDLIIFHVFRLDKTILAASLAPVEQMPREDAWLHRSIKKEDQQRAWRAMS